MGEKSYTKKNANSVLKLKFSWLVVGFAQQFNTTRPFAPFGHLVLRGNAQHFDKLMHDVDDILDKWHNFHSALFMRMKIII